MINTHLSYGRTILVPYLLIDVHHIEDFEQLASIQEAQLFEIFLPINKENAIEKLRITGHLACSGITTPYKK